MSLRFVLDQLNPEMREQAQRKLDEIGVPRDPHICEGPASERGRGRPKRRMAKSVRDLLTQMAACRIADYRLEFRFHRERKWRIDVALVRERVAVEVEGGIWLKGGGRHNRGAGFEKDCLKYGELAVRGWMVLRVTGGMIKSGQAIGLIERALEHRKKGGGDDAGDDNGHGPDPKRSRSQEDVREAAGA